MRLLQRSDDGTFSLTEEYFRNVPPYAILSHRWYEATEEVTLADIMNGTGRNKRGYSKLTFCANYAASQGLDFFWADTCCIDKTNSVELQEAINSMFRWYQRSARCYVYMSDVLYDDNTAQPFHESEWFHRGWTLQEFIAPSSVEFFDQRGIRIGDKKSLLYKLVKITGIPSRALSGSSLKDARIKDRLSWASRRVTTREGDEAYCLLGIVGVYMPLLYGEGLDNACRRLVREVTLSQSWIRRYVEFVDGSCPHQNPSGILQNLFSLSYLLVAVTLPISISAVVGHVFLLITIEKRQFILQVLIGHFMLLALFVLMGSISFWITLCITRGRIFLACRAHNHDFREQRLPAKHRRV